MAEREKNFDDDRLREHLESQRQQNRDNDSAPPSLVSLVEGDNNAIFKPVTFISIIGTIIFAIVTTVTQIINFNNTFSEMDKIMRRNVDQMLDMRNEIDVMKEDIRSQLVSSNDESLKTINNVAERLVDLERKVNEEMRITTTNITRNSNTIDKDMESLKSSLRDLRDRVRGGENDVREIETSLKVLEIRYERITDK